MATLRTADALYSSELPYPARFLSSTTRRDFFSELGEYLVPQRLSRSSRSWTLRISVGQRNNIGGNIKDFVRKSRKRDSNGDKPKDGSDDGRSSDDVSIADAIKTAFLDVASLLTKDSDGRDHSGGSSPKDRNGTIHGNKASGNGGKTSPPTEKPYETTTTSTDRSHAKPSDVNKPISTSNAIPTTSGTEVPCGADGIKDGCNPNPTSINPNYSTITVISGSTSSFSSSASGGQPVGSSLSQIPHSVSVPVSDGSTYKLVSHPTGATSESE